MEETLIVRVRGTFIEIAPDSQVIAQKGRSISAPPSPVAKEDKDSSSEDMYLTSWIEKAERLPRSLPAREQLEIKAQIQTFSTVPHKWCNEEIFCMCGSSFLPNARFCFQCGTANTGPVLNCGVTGISRPEVKGLPLWSSLGDTSPPTGSDSMDTPRSLCSCGQASTQDSLPLALATGCTTDKLACQEVVTTLMICDIPCRQTINQVVDAINDHGFAGTYDFVYMPPQKGFRRPKHSQNMGYAFVNFKLPEDAAAFSAVFQNYRFPRSLSTKLSYTKPAHTQGFKENLEIHSKHRSPGWLVTFPEDLVY